MTGILRKLKGHILPSKGIPDPQTEVQSFFLGYYERHPVSQKTKDLEVLETHRILEEQRNAYLKKRKQGVIRY